MSSKVYFAPIKNDKHNSQLKKIESLMASCGIDSMFSEGNLIAVKVHFGEYGNTTHLRPIFVRPVVERLKSLKTKPYLTDTNTLYVGMRSNSVDHVHNAFYNGFNYGSLQVPVIIGDGLRGENTVEVEVDLEYCKSVKLAGDIINADGMVVVSHFKAHEVTGFGGAIKNIAMGCASRGGKQDMHSKTRPVVNSAVCTSCGQCVSACQVNAISMVDTAVISEECVGCARCISVCPVEAIDVSWDETSDNTQLKLIEYAKGVDKVFNSNILYINILTDMTPACDCYGGSGEVITRDIGFLASKDPVALDKASCDLVLEQAGHDVFKDIYPHLDWKVQFDHAKKTGLGSVSYELKKI